MTLHAQVRIRDEKKASHGHARLPKQKPGGWSRYTNRSFYLFVAPWILGFLGLTVGPMLYALFISFTNTDGVTDRWRWVGLANYLEVFHDLDALHSMGRTLLYIVVSVPLGLVFALLLAVLLNRPMRSAGFFRTLFYLPSVVPIVGAAVIWQQVLNRDTGALNALIEHLGGPTIDWLSNSSAFYAIIIMVLWGVGGGMVIFLAGLQGIPGELLEAAALDGAGPWRVFRAVTLPLLSPVIFFQLVLSVIGSFQILTQTLLLTPGATPDSSAYFYMVYVYNIFLNDLRYGYGAALLWVLFAIVLILTLLVFRSSSLWVYYEVDQD